MAVSTAQGVPVDDDSIMLIRSGQCRLVRTVQRSPRHGLIAIQRTNRPRQPPQTIAARQAQTQHRANAPLRSAAVSSRLQLRTLEASISEHKVITTQSPVWQPSSTLGLACPRVP
jgi:hypothetical protein